MIEQGLFKKHFVGRDGFIWWLGQIAPAESWKKNIPANPNEESPGFGERYKVRIMGYHTNETKELSDDDLPWAQVMYPVTAGGGGGGACQSANITQGAFVFGFFMDGEDAQQPVIMGVLGFNDYNEVMSNPTEKRFIPLTGYEPDDAVAVTQIKAEKGGEVIPLRNKDGGTNRNDTITESVNGSNSQVDFSSKEQKEDTKRERTIATPEDCKSKIGKIQKDIQNSIKEVEKLKKSQSSYQNALAKRTSDIQSKINKILKEFAAYIAEGIKWIITQIEKAVIKKLNDKAKKLYNKLFPNEQAELKKSVESANDLIACLFKKIIAALFQMVLDFLTEAVDKAVNAPTCLVNNFLGSLFGGIAGLIDGIIGQATGLINSALGSLGGGGGGGLGGLGGGLDIIKDVLSFLSCEEDPECPEIDEWDFWTGEGQSAFEDLNGIIEKITEFSENLGGGSGGSGGSGGGGGGDFNIDFGSVFGGQGDNGSSCNSGPQACGPPTANIFGGNGSGAAFNLIISASGSVIGSELVNAGSGYQSGNTYAKVQDNCGKGNGAVITAVLGPVSLQNGVYLPDPNGDQIGVIDLIINDGGTGYLPTFDGSTGGDGRTWAEPDDTTIQRDDGTYEVPIPPGNVVEVLPGDTVCVPSDVVTDLGEKISGCQKITIGGKFTTPKPVLKSLIGTYPITSLGSYPAVMYLCEILINNPGINYSASDKIVITPSNGAEAVPSFDKFGTLTGIKVTKGGEGFTESPRVYIQSDTGFNALLTPRLCIDRIGENIEKPVTGGLVTVIDCVGKV